MKGNKMFPLCRSNQRRPALASASVLPELWPRRSPQLWPWPPQPLLAHHYSQQPTRQPAPGAQSPVLEAAGSHHRPAALQQKVCRCRAAGLRYVCVYSISPRAGASSRTRSSRSSTRARRPSRPSMSSRTRTCARASSATRTGPPSPAGLRGGRVPRRVRRDGRDVPERRARRDPREGKCAMPREPESEAD